MAEPEIYQQLVRGAQTLPPGKVPATFGEVLASSAEEVWRGWVTGFRGREEAALLQEYDELLRQQVGETLYTPDVAPPGAMPGIDLRKHPGAVPGAKRRLYELAKRLRLKNLPTNDDEFNRQVAERVRAAEEAAQSAFERGPSGWRWVARFAGAMGPAIADPLVAPTLFIGAAPRAASMVRLMLREAAIGGVSEAAVQAAVQPERAKLGLDAGFAQAAAMVMLAAAGGPVALAAGRGVGRVWRELAARARKAGIEHPAVDVLERAADVVDEAPPTMKPERHARRFEETRQALDAEVPPPQPARREALPGPAGEAGGRGVMELEIELSDGERLAFTNAVGQAVLRAAHRAAARNALPDVLEGLPQEAVRAAAEALLAAKAERNFSRRLDILEDVLEPGAAVRAARMIDRLPDEVFEIALRRARNREAPPPTAAPVPKDARAAQNMLHDPPAARSPAAESEGRAAREAAGEQDQEVEQMLNVLRNQDPDTPVRVPDERTEGGRPGTVRELIEEIDRDEKVMESVNVCVGRAQPQKEAAGEPKPKPKPKPNPKPKENKVKKPKKAEEKPKKAADKKPNDRGRAVKEKNKGEVPKALEKRMKSVEDRFAKKPVEDMTNAEIDSLAERIDKLSSSLDDEIVAQGFGSVKFKDAMKQADQVPLFNALRRVSDIKNALRAEAKRRYGPEASPGNLRSYGVYRRKKQ